MYPQNLKKTNKSRARDFCGFRELRQIPIGITLQIFLAHPSCPGKSEPPVRIGHVCYVCYTLNNRSAFIHLTVHQHQK